MSEAPLSLWKFPQQVLSGRGALQQLPSALQKLGIQKVLVVTDPGLVKTGLAGRLGDLLGAAGCQHRLFDAVIPEPPLSCLNEAVSFGAESGGVDGVIGVGGGSAMDVAKLCALLLAQGGDVRDYVGVDATPGRGLPSVLIPTTAGTGSEVTPVAIVTDVENQLKVGVVDKNILPDLALVDPALTDSCPPEVTAATGLDALTHAIEAYISRKTNPLSQALALQAAELLHRSLRSAFREGQNQSARDDLALGATLAGMAFGNSSCCAVHALSYPLGGRYHVPHGLANALLLSATMRFNAPACEEAFPKLAAAMGVPAEGFLDALDGLCRDLEIPASLKSVGVELEALPEMARDAMAIDRLMAPNPRRLSLSDAEDIYRAVF